MEETKTTGVATVEKPKLPTLAELTQDVELAYKNDQFNLLVNQQPPEKWVKEHPFIKGYNYLPIDKVEYLLRRIFKTYKIEITDKGTAFNGVFVQIRLTVINPTTGDVMTFDGIGASQLQTKKDTSPADLANINNGALSMAFPLAKTLAIKDAADHIGKLFGADLNRKDTLSYQPDMEVEKIVTDKIKLAEFERIKAMLFDCATVEEVEALQEQCPEFPIELYNERKIELL